jgi:hypothetical protein
MKHILKTIKWWWFDFKQGCKNIKMFWRVIWRFKPWDYAYQLQLWRASLVPLRDAIQAGNEVEVPRLKKVAKIQRCIDLIDRIQANDYFALAEAELGELVEFDLAIEYHVVKLRKIMDLSEKMAEDDWSELWRILQGQRFTEFLMMHEKLKSTNHDAYDDWFDGSGMKTWWD